ncbi:MAG: hypothetical protein KGJ23_08290 [Euryarchaeota archaeon]|nr:hypothetical protein [Euryarchaeota archaeon]MDE1836601.1 hypothetical protein [Euryarchaeota archaeon]MDE1879204.1 hypothetical protein [Euryarchaeota archaeon]MDE2044571.1 hypothetical protein [Thermoplasmata archaeon]
MSGFSFDLDDTLFGPHGRDLCVIMAALKSAGHQVGILTARPDVGRRIEEAEVRSLGCPEPDFWLDASQMNEDEFDRSLRPATRDEALYDFKLREIRDRDLTHFDDRARILHRRDPSAKLLRPY